MTVNLRRGAIEKILGQTVAEAVAPFTTTAAATAVTKGSSTFMGSSTSVPSFQVPSLTLPWSNTKDTSIFKTSGSLFSGIDKLPSIGSAFSTTAALATSEAAGNYYLQVLFYFLLYGFVVFLVSILIHFTITPIFRFVPGGKGIIPVPSVSDSIVYWNSSSVPVPEERVPIMGDSLSTYQFENQFSFSIDIFIRRLTDTTNTKRVILYKTYAYGPSLTTPINAPSSNTTSLTDPGTTDLLTYMQGRTSMVLYLTSENDLVLTFFTGNTGTNYSCSPIKNIPLYTPFRIGAIVDKKIFTLYLNGKQTFQRVLPSVLLMNGSNSLPTTIQKFYALPAWASSPTQTIFVHNFILWPRAVTYGEIQSAQPTLAREADFNMPAEPTSITA